MRSTGFVVSVFAAFTLGGIAACASAQTEQPASRIEQIAVRVNKEAISAFQVDLTMAQTPEIKPEQRDAVGKATLERLIDLSLASQKAREVKLDQNPVMVQALELARNQILAQAYLTQAGKVAGQPAEADAKRYFDANPALFAERRVYQLQELTIAVQPAHVGEVKGKLMAAKTIKEVLSLLDAAQVKYNSTWAVRAAEQIALNRLPTLHRMKDGQIDVTETQDGLQVIHLAVSETRPVSFEQARPAIEKFLVNEMGRQLVEAERLALRKGAKLEYGAPLFAPVPTLPEHAVVFLDPALMGQLHY